MTPPPTLPGFLGSLAPVLNHYGYLAVAGLVVLEDFGVPVPGETVLIAAAVYAGAGRLNVVLVGIIAVAAAVIGDNAGYAGYAIGRFGGRALALRYGRYVFLTSERRGPGGPGEAGRLGQLAGDLIGDQAAQGVGVPGRQLRVHPALDFHPQRPAGPAGPGMRVNDPGYRSGRGLGPGDHVRIHAVGQAAQHVGGDLVADVTDERCHRQPGHQQLGQAGHA